MKNLPQNWLVRRGERVTGPYPAGLVSRYILLGRIRLDDEVSADGATWLSVREVDALVPQVLRDAEAHPDVPELQERLQLARRWADERCKPHVPLPEGSERRRSDAVTRARGVIEAKSIRPRRVHYLVLILLVMAVVAVPFLLPEPEPTSVSDCSAAPAPGVNWSACLLGGRDLANMNLANAVLRSADLNTANLRAANLQRGDLAYVNFALANLRGANLSHASLFGANLRGADMINANLRNADLRYAILSDAQRDGADFTGARLDFAEWVPGILCLENSVGTCRMR